MDSQRFNLPSLWKQFVFRLLAMMVDIRLASQIRRKKNTRDLRSRLKTKLQMNNCGKHYWKYCVSSFPEWISHKKETRSGDWFSYSLFFSFPHCFLIFHIHQVQYQIMTGISLMWLILERGPSKSQLEGKRENISQNFSLKKYLLWNPHLDFAAETHLYLTYFNLFYYFCISIIEFSLCIYYYVFSGSQIILQPIKSFSI